MEKKTAEKANENEVLEKKEADKDLTGKELYYKLLFGI